MEVTLLGARSRIKLTFPRSVPAKDRTTLGRPLRQSPPVSQVAQGIQLSLALSEVIIHFPFLTLKVAVSGLNLIAKLLSFLENVVVAELKLTFRPTPRLARGLTLPPPKTHLNITLGTLFVTILITQTTTRHSPRGSPRRQTW